EGQGLVHRHLTELVDGDAAHRHRQRLGAQPLSVAVGTGGLAHALLNLPLHGIRLGLLIAAFQVVDDALKGLVQNSLAPRLVVVNGELFSLGAVQNDIQYLGGKLFNGVGEVEVVFGGQGLKVHPGNAVRLDVVPSGGGDGPLQNGQTAVGDDEVR